MRHRRSVLLLVPAISWIACATAGPPAAAPGSRAPDLVEIVRLDPTIRLDIRYATTNNFTKTPVYSQARAFLQRPAAEALVRVQADLAPRGYGLLVFDGYRPWAVTKRFWEIASPKEREEGFVANPAKGSKHNRGCAVDLTLYDLATGREIEMPSGYDEFTERADPDYAGGTPAQRAARDLLRAAMEKEGFEVDPGEWWHFNYKDWQSYPILDIPFEAIRGSEGPPHAGLETHRDREKDGHLPA
jgi:D-alanyl-D-alanine dipeptidase